MAIRKIIVAGIVVFMFNLFGCKTVPKKVSKAELEEFEELSVAPLKEKIVSSREIEFKEGPLVVLREKIGRQAPSHEKVVVAKKKASHIAPARDIQTALKNAGYYTANIDGKIGPQTEAAIKAFQKDNALKVDGVVGRRTWDILNKYLSSPQPGQAPIAPIVPPVVPPLGTALSTVPGETAAITTNDIVSEPAPSYLEEVPPLETAVPEEELSSTRNFTPIIIIIIIILIIVLAVSLYRRQK